MHQLNPLEGKRLHYLIGHDGASRGVADVVTVVGYDTKTVPRLGVGVKYCNLFDEKNTGRYGPYLHTSDTAKQYNEGQIDPRGAGWEKNLRGQFERAKRQGFKYVELDNADAYMGTDVLEAIVLASRYDLKVLAKNPPGDSKIYISHPDVVGIIVEAGAGNPPAMNRLRCKAGKPKLPVWFVAFGRQRAWAENVGRNAIDYVNMGVSFSSLGEYENSMTILRPWNGHGHCFLENE